MDWSCSIKHSEVRIIKNISYKTTLTACFIGYIIQAIVNNFVPMLFLRFQAEFGIPLAQITWLITINFAVQLTVDAVAPAFVDKIGYRASMQLAHILSASGFLLMTVLPDKLPSPFAGLVICIALYAVGGGLLEVLVSPIVEACPTDNKETAMSLLHSFYCWGQAATVLLSTVFFAIAGIEHWRILAALWSIVPMLNFILFLKVPIAALSETRGQESGLAELIRTPGFLFFCLMMLCAGACELTVSQWTSAFAESGLQISKSAGDLIGTMGFAICMGSARALFSKFGEKIPLQKVMLASSVLCVGSYLLIGLTKAPAAGLIGCMLCGFSVGIFWPGTFSLSAARLRNGGTLMFALLALAGDLGCCAGPTIAGKASALFGSDLHRGILCGIVFPCIMLCCVLLMDKEYRKGEVRNGSK